MTIVITGNPGVGKHTITKEIAQKLQLEILDINYIARDSGLLEKNAQSGDVDTEQLKAVLRERIKSNSVIVGHLAPYAVEKDQIDTVIVLRRNPYDLLKVYRERQYDVGKSVENAASEILGVIAHDAINQFEEKVFQIDASKKDISEVVSRIENIISGDEKSKKEKVDWLYLVAQNNDLKKFFVD